MKEVINSAKIEAKEAHRVSRREFLVLAGGAVILGFLEEPSNEKHRPYSVRGESEITGDVPVFDTQETDNQNEVFLQSNTETRIVVPGLAADGSFPIKPEPEKPPDKKYNAPDLFRTADPKKPNIFITIDDWWRPDVLELAIKTAEDAGAKLTFFPVGRVLSSSPDLWKHVIENHELANHTWNHPNLTQLSDSAIRDELSRFNEKAQEIAGYEYWVKWMRPPGGAVNGRVVNIAKEFHMKTALWSSDSNGWRVYPRTDEDAMNYIMNNVMQNFFPGIIILLHGNPNDIYAIADIIEAAREYGYKCMNMRESIE